MDLKQLYQDIILDHGRNPRNLRKCENFNREAKGYNPLCGDEVHVYLDLNSENKIKDISFEGAGCAISMASASIMTDLVKGKDILTSKKIIKDYLGLIKDKSKLESKEITENEKTKMMSLSGVKDFPMRVKCATLAWHTLTAALDNSKNEVNTEKFEK